MEKRLMHRRTLSPLTALLVMLFVTVSPEHAFEAAQAGQTTPAPAPAAQTTPQAVPGQAGPGEPIKIPLDLFKLPDGLEVTLWASSPLLYNPTNMDIDEIA